jgi:uncharacterized membrane protein
MADTGISLPTDFHNNFLIALRLIHFLAGITWIGLLYFFNLVSTPVSKEIDFAARAKVFPKLMLRALWWFRWSAFVTVIAGLMYWGNMVAGDAGGPHATSGTAMGSFFGIWTAVWAIFYAMLRPGKGVLNKGAVLGVLVTILVIVASWLFLRINNHGWESNNTLAIGIGGGIGWVLMLNVWGIVWRIQKRVIAWTQANAENGTPIPEKAAAMTRMAFLTSRVSAWLTIPLLFFMAVASHYPMFVR